MFRAVDTSLNLRKLSSRCRQINT